MAVQLTTRGRIQRYEGASTLYGPHTLAAYIDRTLNFLPYLSATHHSDEQFRESEPLPPDNSNRSLSFIPGVVFDGTPWFKNFGDVKSDVERPILRKGDRANATFVGANPRNNLRQEQSYAGVEFRDGIQGEWQTVRDDSDWGLMFNWKRTSEILGTSEVEIVWEIEEWVQPGEYRLRYYGDAKSVGGRITAFEGVSRAFRVV